MGVSECVCDMCISGDHRSQKNVWKGCGPPCRVWEPNRASCKEPSLKFLDFNSLVSVQAHEQNSLNTLQCDLCHCLSIGKHN